MHQPERVRLVRIDRATPNGGVRLTWLPKFPSFKISANADTGFAGGGNVRNARATEPPVKIGWPFTALNPWFFQNSLVAQSEPGWPSLTPGLRRG